MQKNIFYKFVRLTNGFRRAFDITIVFSREEDDLNFILGPKIRSTKYKFLINLSATGLICYFIEYKRFNLNSGQFELTHL